MLLTGICSLGLLWQGSPAAAKELETEGIGLICTNTSGKSFSGEVICFTEDQASTRLLGSFFGSEELSDISISVSYPIEISRHFITVFADGKAVKLESPEEYQVYTRVVSSEEPCSEELAQGQPCSGEVERGQSCSEELAQGQSCSGEESVWGQEKQVFYEYTYVISKACFPREGIYHIQPLAQDKEGRLWDYTWISGEPSLAFGIDDTPPQILIYPLENGKSYGEKVHRVDLQITDNMQVSSVEIWVNQELMESYREAAGTIPRDAWYSFALQESKRQQQITIIAEDIAGNQEVFHANVFVTTNPLVRILGSQVFPLAITAFAFIAVVIVVCLLGHVFGLIRSSYA